MKENVQALRNRLASRINLLVVDDQEIVRQSIVRMFASPLFAIQTADSFQSANEAIRAAQWPWHCWIVDIALEREDSGLFLLVEHIDFPFMIMLSGLGSMSLASRAMQAGAIAVFDKDPKSLNSLYELVCAIAALAFLLGGKNTKYLSTFRLLEQSAITSPDDWAQKACISVRQLERICAIHSPLTPRLFRPLFYAIRYLLVCGKNESQTNWPFSISRDFHEESLEQALNNFETYQQLNVL